jgi:hypothetical protein
MLGYLRTGIFVMALVALSLLPGSAAQKDPLSGTWRGTSLLKGASPINIDLILRSDGHYAERTKYNGGKSVTFGRYAVVSKNLIRFMVDDWEPRQDCSKPAPCDRIPKPPDFEYHVTALTLTAMTFKEKKHAGIITFKRVR